MTEYANQIKPDLKLRLVTLYRSEEFKGQFYSNYKKAGLSENFAEKEFINAFNLIANNHGNDSLLLTTFEDIKSAFLTISEMGLSFNPSKKECYLSVCKYEHAKNHSIEIIIGYMGMQALIIRSGKVHHFSDMIVYEDDNFNFLGSDKRPEIVSTCSHDQNSIIRCGVITFHFENGEILTHVVPKNELEELIQQDQMRNEAIHGKADGSLYLTAWKEKILRIAILRSAFKKYRHMITKLNAEPDEIVNKAQSTPNEFEQLFLS